MQIKKEEVKNIKLKNKLILPIVATMILGAGIFGAAYTFAQGTGQYSSIVQKIAAKFNLNPADVQSVFNENRTERISQMQTKFEDTLTQDVKDGKITDAQEQLILDKRKELLAQSQTNRDTWKNMTPDQRKTVFDNQKNDLQNWAKQNGIDIKYLFGGFGRFRGFGMRGGMHMMMR